MKALKSKTARIIAFLLAVGLVCYCALECVSLFFKYDSYELNDILTDYSYTEELNELYTDLWAVCNLYLRNTDGNGNYTVNDFEKQSIMQALDSLGLISRNGNITVKSDNFDYVAMYNGKVITNLDNPEQLEYNDAYTLEYSDDTIFNWPYFMHVWYNNNYWYTNNEGFYYYYIDYYSMGIAVYDYDTSGLDHYTDDYEATIYLNADGSSPIPTIFTDNYEQITDRYVSRTMGDTSEFSVRINPKANLIAAINDLEAREHEIEKYILDKVLSLIPFAAAVLILTIYMLITGGYSTKEGKYKTGILEKTHLEFCVIVIAAAITAFCVLLFYDPIAGLRDLFEQFGYFKMSVRITYGAGIPFIYAILLIFTNSLITRLKCKAFLNTSLIFIIAKKIFSAVKKAILKAKKHIITKQMLKDNIYLRDFLVRLAIFCVLEFIVLIITLASEWVPVFFIGTVILIAFFIIANARDLNELTLLSKHIRDISKGDYSEVSVEDDAVTYAMHENLNNISTGIQSAVNRQIKSERMKIDLVTNVSHDLKTPLTSIISYIDLLSKEELAPEARDYVTILEEKSARLKTMVSDLFDLAKATSRTDVSLEQIDAVILVGQVLGDLSDKIESSGMDIRTNIALQSAPVFADGKKLYRVLQNLIDNALKYSMPKTRIYISLDKIENDAVIRVQNISAYEMTFTADEITERFTRGDESRSTEGNGLGLSIAKSFTEACGGRFNVRIEGDSFTAEVKIELIN